MTHHIVRLRGLPFSATEEDIADFLEMPELLDETDKTDEDAKDPDEQDEATMKNITFVMAAHGKRTGDAFVVVPDSEAVQRCVAKHRQYIRERYVEVYPSNEEEMEAVLSMPPMPNSMMQRYHMSSYPGGYYPYAGYWDYLDGDMSEEPVSEQEIIGGYVVRMRGLPFSATATDVEDFYGAELQPLIIDISQCYTPDQRPTGIVFVTFTSEEAQKSALKKDRALMGQRYIELFESSPEERARALRRNVEWSDYNMMMVQSGDFIIRLRGLPFNATEVSVAQFLDGINIAPRGVHLVFNGDDKFTGEAFVEVLTSTDVVLATDRNTQRMGHRYIEVYPSCFDEMMSRGMVIDPVAMSPIAPAMLLPAIPMYAFVSGY
eukprot:PhM_4_TR9472/c0_g1_i1/m.2148/K14947/ESRP1_2; epithelial splicing regulatory protein 1/2